MRVALCLLCGLTAIGACSSRAGSGDSVPAAGSSGAPSSGAGGSAGGVAGSPSGAGGTGAGGAGLGGTAGGGGAGAGGVAGAAGGAVGGTGGVAGAGGGAGGGAGAAGSQLASGDRVWAAGIGDALAGTQTLDQAALDVAFDSSTGGFVVAAALRTTTGDDAALVSVDGMGKAMPSPLRTAGSTNVDRLKLVPLGLPGTFALAATVSGEMLAFPGGGAVPAKSPATLRDIVLTRAKTASTTNSAAWSFLGPVNRLETGADNTDRAYGLTESGGFSYLAADSTAPLPLGGACGNTVPGAGNVARFDGLLTCERLRAFPPTGTSPNKQVAVQQAVQVGGTKEDVVIVSEYFGATNGHTAPTDKAIASFFGRATLTAATGFSWIHYCDPKVVTDYCDLSEVAIVDDLACAVGAYGGSPQLGSSAVADAARGGLVACTSLSAPGTIAWSGSFQTAATAEYHVARSVSTAGSNLYVTGSCAGALAYRGKQVADCGATGSFLAKLSTVGDLLWLHTLGRAMAWRVLAANGLVVVVGAYGGGSLLVDGTPQASVPPPAANDRDGFVLAFAP